ncbi:MAG TPA: DUF2878 domain-containing protein [Xanthomonadales bacterium]|nr:DUF2878 domain-containing protein [Xanthomonadales bacterium]
MSRHWLGGPIANAVGFQGFWLATVWSAGVGLVWLGPLLAVLFTIVTLRFGGRRSDDLRLLALALPIGLVLDTLWLRLGWLSYPHPWPLEGIAPGWIMALWVGFALTLNHSLAFLRERLWLAMAFGGLGGPLAYLAAERAFSAVVLAAPTGRILFALALSWGLLVPLLYAVGRALPRPFAPLPVSRP